MTKLLLSPGMGGETKVWRGTTYLGVVRPARANQQGVVDPKPWQAVTPRQAQHFAKTKDAAAEWLSRQSPEGKS